LSIYIALTHKINQNIYFKNFITNFKSHCHFFDAQWSATNIFCSQTVNYIGQTCDITTTYMSCHRKVEQRVVKLSCTQTYI